eukprot:Pgem_evm1s17689
MATTTKDTMVSYSGIAEFVEKKFQPCRHMTANCPNDCGHAKDIYEFNCIDITDVRNEDSKHTQWVTSLKNGDK